MSAGDEVVFLLTREELLRMNPMSPARTPAGTFSKPLAGNRQLPAAGQGHDGIGGVLKLNGNRPNIAVDDVRFPIRTGERLAVAHLHPGA